MQVVQLHDMATLGYYTFYTKSGQNDAQVFWISTELVARDHRVAHVITHDRWRSLCGDRPCRLLAPTAEALRFGKPLTPKGIIVLEGEHETTNAVTGAAEVRVTRWWYSCVVVVSPGEGNDGSPAYGGNWLWELSKEEVEHLMAAMQADQDYASSALLDKDLLAPTAPLEFDALQLDDYVERVTDFSRHPNKERIYATMMHPMCGPLGDGIRQTETEQIGTGIHQNFAMARRAWLAERPRAVFDRQRRTDRQHARSGTDHVLQLHHASLRARMKAPFDDYLPEELRHYLWSGLASFLAERHTTPLPQNTARRELLKLRLVCRETNAAVKEIGVAATTRLMRAWMKSWAEGSSPEYTAWLRFFCCWYGMSPLDVEWQFTKAVLNRNVRHQFDAENLQRTRWILFLRLFFNIPPGRSLPATVRSLRIMSLQREKRRVVLRLQRGRQALGARGAQR